MASKLLHLHTVNFGIDKVKILVPWNSILQAFTVIKVSEAGYEALHNFFGAYYYIAYVATRSIDLLDHHLRNSNLLASKKK